MKSGEKTSEFWLFVGIVIATFALIVYIVEKEGAESLSFLATVLPFVYTGAGWYQHKRNDIKKDK